MAVGLCASWEELVSSDHDLLASSARFSGRILPCAPVELPLAGDALLLALDSLTGVPAFGCSIARRLRATDARGSSA